MAEDAVSYLLGKLKDATIKEAFFLYGVDDQVKRVKRELKRIKSVLNDADSKRNSDDSAKNWVSEVTKVSYWIEDAIDAYLAEVWTMDDSTNIFGNFLINGPRKLFLKHNLGIEINKILAMISEIATQSKKYTKNFLGESSNAHANSLKRKIVLPNAHREIVGFESDKTKIIDLLLEETDLKLRVVSIVGQGGLGKTTLAQKIYNSIEVKESRFDMKIWLTVSQEYKSIDLEKAILGELRPIHEGEKDEQKICGEIHELLSKRKYLIVLDDIWEGNLWVNLFEPTLPDKNNGSRVLITTRSSDVAKTANPNGVHKLQLLNNNESVELLLKKAIHDGGKNYPSDIVKLANELIKPSGGLPLALVVLGGILSVRPQNAWDKVMINWDGEENECMNIIAPSYEDLPLLLKKCFIYLALFPKEYVFETESLVRLWIAEGFVTKSQVQSWIAEGFITDGVDGAVRMEDLGNNHLEQLAQRCMIGVLKRSDDGSIENFHVHYLIHKFALLKAKEKDFSSTVLKIDDIESTSVTRRIAFLGKIKDEKFDQEKGNPVTCSEPKIRTLLFHDTENIYFSRFKFLRVLMVKTYVTTNNLDLCNSLKGLLHLRYLEIANVSGSSKTELTLGHLRNLQTLKLRSDHKIEFKTSLLGIKTLRHLVIYPVVDGSDYIVLGPANLPYLQTLEVAVITGPIKGSLNMPNLRKLHLRNKTSNWPEIVLTFLASLNFLYSLHLECYRSQGLKFPSEIILSSSKHLHTLTLIGELPMDVKIDTFPPSLRKLTLEKSRILDQRIIAAIGKLPCLEYLELDRHSYGGEKLIFSEGEFCKLRVLVFDYLVNMNECVIELGALPALNDLQIRHCFHLEELPDLQHVTSLNTLYLEMLKGFNERAQHEDQNKIKHVSKITYIIWV